MQGPVRLIFDWPGRHQLHLVLPFMLIVAAVLHAGIFFVFSIVYPISEGERPDPISAYFPLAGSDDAQRLAVLLPADDPAIFAPGRGDAVPASTTVAYLPTYAATGSALAPLPTLVQPKVSAEANFGPVRMPVSPRPAARPPLPTRLEASAPLATRAPALPAGSQFATSGRIPPETLSFLVNVRADGKVAHVFLQDSSGDAALDTSAATLLAQLAFAPSDSEETWGDISFSWGNDVQPSAAR